MFFITYTFDSFTGRDEFTGYTMPFSKKNDYPGPGFYTNNWDLLGDNNKQLKFNLKQKIMETILKILI